jgi:hypothetical protein
MSGGFFEKLKAGLNRTTATLANIFLDRWMKTRSKNYVNYSLLEISV